MFLVLHVLDQKHALRHRFQNRETLVDAIHDESSRHAAEYLRRHYTMCMRVIPEHAGTLPVVRRDLHEVVESFARVDVDKDVVAMSAWRDAHAMKVEIARLVW